MSTRSDSEEKIMSKNGEDSPSADDANNGGNVDGNGSLKKGPWTTAEDAILVEYVTKHGEGNWNAVQKHLGLARCGKSCRLRWANHLRPDLKKGAFTPEEEHHIIELHAKMGNKWARMAAEMPGRTDNEIKNYWNTRIKRRQRAGLPIYPPDMCLQALNENKQRNDMHTFSSVNASHPDFLLINNFEIPKFKSLELNQQLCSSALFDIPDSSFEIPVSSLLAQGLHSSHPNKLLLSMVNPSEPFLGSESLVHGLYPTVGNIIAEGSQYHSDDFVQIAHSFIFSSACDYNSTSDHASILPGSHAILNRNSSSSEPAWAMKLELPSLQTEMGSWGSPSSPLPSLESVDTLIQTPPEHTQSCNLSPGNSGLLDAVLYESQIMKISKNSFDRQISHALDMNSDTMDTSSQDLHKTEWKTHGESVSPSGHSSLLVFTEYTPIGGNSLDDISVETMPGYKAKEATDLVLMQYDNNETTKEMIFSRPDFVFASNSFGLPRNIPC